ncbi:hypothetical protein Q7P37_011271 [Cladosporium fusiforme]
MSIKVVGSKMPTANRLFFINFERHPEPLNVATFQTTRNFADPRSNHPYHIRTVRRVRAFDASKLHWFVNVPADVSRSAFIRNRAGRRVREAFRAELRKAGWDSDGRRIEAAVAGGPAVPPVADLSGALKLGLVKDSFAVTATPEEIQLHASWAVRSVVALQNLSGKDAGPSNRKGGFKRQNGKTMGKTNGPAEAQGLKIHRIMSKD